MGSRPSSLLLADAMAELAASPRPPLPKVSVPILRGVPLFAGLSDRQLRKVARLATVARVGANVAVVKEGAAGHSFYVILEGRVSVRRGDRTVATLGAGDHFGEMALLDRRPRSATVRTETSLTALRISAAPFRKLLGSEPALALALLENLSIRLRELERGA